MGEDLFELVKHEDRRNGMVTRAPEVRLLAVKAFPQGVGVVQGGRLDSGDGCGGDNRRADLYGRVNGPILVGNAKINREEVLLPQLWEDARLQQGRLAQARGPEEHRQLSSTDKPMKLLRLLPPSVEVFAVLLAECGQAGPWVVGIDGAQVRRVTLKTRSGRHAAVPPAVQYSRTSFLSLPINPPVTRPFGSLSHCAWRNRSGSAFSSLGVSSITTGQMKRMFG